MEGVFDKVELYIDKLEDKDRAIAWRAVATSILGKDLVGYLGFVNKISNSEIKEEFRDEVKPIVSHNKTVARMWRACILALHNKKNWELGAKEFGVDPKELEFLWNSLEWEGKIKVWKNSKSVKLLTFMSRQEWARLIKDLNSFCKMTAYRLRFLSDSDPAITMEDLHAELLKHGIQAAKNYEHFHKKEDNTRDIDKIRTHAQRAIKNHRINMIYYYTRNSRARVQKTTSGCGQCQYCLSGTDSRCVNKIVEFRSTTVSTDVLLRNTGDGRKSRTLLETLLSENAGLDVTSNIRSDEAVEDSKNNEFIEILYEFIEDNKIKKLLDIVLDIKTHEDFEEWILKEKRNTKNITSLAMKYLNLPVKKVRKEILTAIKDYHDSY